MRVRIVVPLFLHLLLLLLSLQAIDVTFTVAVAASTNADGDSNGDVEHSENNSENTTISDADAGANVDADSVPHKRRQQQQQRKKKKQRKRKAKAPIVLPPPTVRHHRPLSGTRRWLRSIGIGLRTGIFPFRKDESSSSSSSSSASGSNTNKNATAFEDAFYDPKKGFEMGVLATLSYWEFHKKAAPKNATGFALAEKRAESKINPKAYRDDDDDAKHTFYSSRLLRWCTSVIRESIPTSTASLPISTPANAKSKAKANAKVHKTKNPNPYYSLEYSFYNWHEPTVGGLKFHDTDVLISTTSSSSAYASTLTKLGMVAPPDTLVIAFAGTSSMADAVTNCQTFEPANHSRFFEPPPREYYSRKGRMKLGVWRGTEDKDKDKDSNANANATATTSMTQGSLHRGFLNAYSRVERGSVLRLGNRNRNDDVEVSSDSTTLLPARWWRKKTKKKNTKSRPRGNGAISHPILESLDRRFGHCALDALGKDESEGEVEATRDGAATATATAAAAADQTKKKKKKKKRRYSDESENSNDNTITDDADVGHQLDEYEDEATRDSAVGMDQKKKKKKKKRRVDGDSDAGTGACRVTDKDGEGEPQVSLAVVLKELVNDALSNGYTVHVTGHSLGGALATLLVLDVLTNSDESGDDSGNSNSNGSGNSNDPGGRRKRRNRRKDRRRGTYADNLYLWTFGAPQLADSLFWESLWKHSSGLRRFLSFTKLGQQQKVHRYVTFSDDGKVDVVSQLAKNTLAAHKERENEKDLESDAESESEVHAEDPIDEGDSDSDIDSDSEDRASPKRKPKKRLRKKPKPSKKPKPKRMRMRWAGINTGVWHGKVAQSLGGVSRGGEVTHFVDAHYLWTPDQEQQQQNPIDELQHGHDRDDASGETEDAATTTATSAIATAGTATSVTAKSAAAGTGTATTTTTTTTTTNTRSSVAAHSMGNYLMGISRESGPDHHPLVPDIPSEWLEFLEIAFTPTSA